MFLDNFFQNGFLDALELGLVFFGLCGLIIALLLTSQENNYFQKQR